MRKIIIGSVLLLSCLTGFSQEYKFTDVVDLDRSEVKSQGNTGTCWSYSTSSFLESEIKRINNRDIDLSEIVESALIQEEIDVDLDVEFTEETVFEEVVFQEACRRDSEKQGPDPAG